MAHAAVNSCVQPFQVAGNEVNIIGVLATLPLNKKFTGVVQSEEDRTRTTIIIELEFFPILVTDHSKGGHIPS